MDAGVVWAATDDWEGGWGGWHAEVAHIAFTDRGLTATGTQIGIEPCPYRLEYSLDACGEGFTTRSLELAATGEDWKRRLRLERDPCGRWTVDAEGGDAAQQPPGGDTNALAGALDCDIGFSALSNTMPVLRHDLHRGPGAEELLMAWVSVPDLSVHPLAQRYTHIALADDGGRVRYESVEGGKVAFTRDLEFDARGLVRVFPGLARRIS